VAPITSTELYILEAIEVNHKSGVSAWLRKRRRLRQRQDIGRDPRLAGVRDNITRHSSRYRGEVLSRPSVFGLARLLLSLFLANVLPSDRQLDPGYRMENAMSDIKGKVKDGIDKAADKTKKAAGKVVDKAKGAATVAGDAMKHAGDKLKHAGK